MPNIMTQQEFLEKSGILTNGSESEIQAAKKEYRTYYQREYRRKRRQERPEVTLSLTVEEALLLQSNAKQYSQSLPGFIKASCLAYLRNYYLVPNHEQVAHIEQLLAMIYGEIQNIVDQRGKETSSIYELLLTRIENIERGVSRQLRRPQTLEETIQDRLKRQPEWRDKLIPLLRS